MSCRCYPHRGAVLVTVLVTLVLLAVIGGALLRLAALERKLLDTRASACQSRWLVEAGLQRAVARLIADANYRGEIWQVEASELFQQAPALVEIAVAHEPRRPGYRRIRVQADFPSGSAKRARTSKEIEFEAPPSGDNP
jgi:Tfp pilus assembly protein PilV